MSEERRPRDAVISALTPAGQPREIRIGCMDTDTERIIRNHVRRHWPGLEVVAVRFEERNHVP